MCFVWAPNTESHQTLKEGISIESLVIVIFGFMLGVGEVSVSGMFDFPVSASDTQHESFMKIITLAVVGSPMY